MFHKGHCSEAPDSQLVDVDDVVNYNLFPLFADTFLFEKVLVGILILLKEKIHVSEQFLNRAKRNLSNKYPRKSNYLVSGRR